MICFPQVADTPAYIDVGSVPPQTGGAVVLDTLCLITTGTLCGRYDYTHFTDEETETQKFAWEYIGSEQQTVVIPGLL